MHAVWMNDVLWYKAIWTIKNVENVKNVNNVNSKITCWQSSKYPCMSVYHNLSRFYLHIFLVFIQLIHFTTSFTHFLWFMLYLQISFSAHLALLVVEVNKELGIVLKSTSLCQVFIQSKNINIANLENFFFIFKSHSNGAYFLLW